MGPGIVRVTAPNAGAFTFTGTNSYLIGNENLFILDPGPRDTQHRAALIKAIGGRAVTAIVLTHTHKDHSALAAPLAAELGAPVWFGGRHRYFRRKRRFEIDPIARSSDWRLVPDRVLEDGEEIATGGIALSVIATPGHCANHLSFGILGTPDLFSGDHVMGWNSTLVAVPDGSMKAYLSSLEKLIDAPFSRYLPAHGGPIDSGPAFARALLLHREARNRQILVALGDGPAGLGTLVRRLYPGLGGRLTLAARMTVQAHLEYLAARGLIQLSGGPLRYRARLR